MAQEKNTTRMFTTILKEKDVARTAKARKAYRKKAQNIARSRSDIKPNKLLIEAKKRKLLKATLKGKMMVGSMYMFRYDPKLKETLPYYDEFPLVFPFQPLADGFLGINMHYLYPKHRAILMDRLYPLLKNTKMDETTRLRLSYDLLNGSAKYKYFKPCIHRYLKSNVESRYIHVPVEEWDIALFLPTDRFVGESRRKVWAESRKKI